MPPKTNPKEKSGKKAAAKAAQDPEKQSLLAPGGDPAPPPAPPPAPGPAPGGGGEVVPDTEPDEPQTGDEAGKEKNIEWKKLFRTMIQFTNVYGIFLNIFFVMLGMVLLLTPNRHYKHKAEDYFVQQTNHKFWQVQGVCLIFLSLKACYATIYCALLKRDPRAIQSRFVRQKVMIFVGSFYSETGRALFYFMAGLYVAPLMQIFSLMANVDDNWVYFSYYAGLTSLGSGSFLLIFDVLFDCWLRDPTEEDAFDYYAYFDNRPNWGRPGRRRDAENPADARVVAAAE
jgi:hypothetical protein